MLDHNEKPFIHLKAQAFVCPFLFQMIFTDLALRVINPFIIKTVLKSPRFYSCRTNIVQYEISFPLLHHKLQHQLDVCPGCVIKIIRQSRQTWSCLQNFSFEVYSKHYAVKLARFPILWKQLAGGGAQCGTFPGNLNVPVLRGTFHQCGDYHHRPNTPIFRKNWHFVGFSTQSAARWPGLGGVGSQTSRRGWWREAGHLWLDYFVFTLFLWLTIKSDRDLKLSNQSTKERLDNKF